MNRAPCGLSFKKLPVQKGADFIKKILFVPFPKGVSDDSPFGGHDGPLYDYVCIWHQTA
jgi:hypothetical protein